jgi:hypothetical protein
LQFKKFDLPDQLTQKFDWTLIGMIKSGTHMQNVDLLVAGYGSESCLTDINSGSGKKVLDPDPQPWPQG